MQEPVMFDDRSVHIARTTGWERYARSLLAALGSAVEPMGLRTRGILGRTLSDWSVIPLRSKHDSVLHLPTYPPSPLVQGPLVWTLHDLTRFSHPETASALGKRYYAPLARQAMGRPDLVIVTPSEQVRTEVVARFGIAPDRVFATPLGLSKLPEPDRSRPRGINGPYLLCVATQEPRKNLKGLVAGYRSSGLFPEVKLVVVGRRGWAPIAADGVVVRDDVMDADLARLYAEAAAFVMPSFYEGFGLPILEAMSYGTPVACSDIPVFREVSGGHAEFFDPSDALSIADGLERVLSNPVDSPVLQRWSRSFSWDRCADVTKTAYARALQL